MFFNTAILGKAGVIMHYKNKEISNMYSVSWVANVTDHMTVEENEVHHILLYLII